MSSSQSKRVRKKLTDQQLLDLLLSGQLRVDAQTADCWMGDRQLKATIVGTEGKNCTRYRYEICYQGAKRSICRYKLVYMAATLMLIPEGFEIHHIDYDRYNDAYGNLIMLTIEDHRKLHGKFKYATEEAPF